MTFKGADEKQIGSHAPIRFLASGDFMQGGEKLGEKVLNGFFNFRAGNVFRLVEINPQIPIIQPPLH